MTARHQQVADDLRRLIASGALAIGERLPPETQLAARYRVSTPTLREALELLRAEGLIEKFQGRGNFVRRPVERLAYPHGAANGLHMNVSSGEITAGVDLSAHLGTPLDTLITEYVCVSHRGDTPQSIAHLYVPNGTPYTTDATSDSPWGDDLVLAASETAPAAYSTDLVTARFPTAAEAQSLRISTRMPVLAVERTFITDDGEVVAYAHLVLPGDRTEATFVTPIGTATETTEKKAEAR
ncbi:GntR family transcriptional regulator [Actinacidiphila alni]|uniref:GntR family transcriptional regulator n=1 Tax=Actinacidiphila alni TaxID=380248 RepID=A0A1I1ZA96_9ACTN|nr:GntR family transcriptional regulator [Actinacidiphila alni]SFE28686.1 GntR family transcriptional regulator [Actinacidiphila alni]